MKTTTLILFILQYSFSYGQTATELYTSRNYEELVKLEKKADQLTPDELYMVGYAFYRLENDTKAIDFYDKAIAKGLDHGSVYFYKGLSLCYLKKYKDAMKEVDIALKKEPTNQEFMNQKGLIYRYQEQEDKALDFFEKATKLPNTYGEPFFWVAYMHHQKQDFTKALTLYYVALDSVPQENSYYQTTLESIGQLEYTHTKDYLKSAHAYTQAIQLDKDNYELYYKLMKSYNAAREYAKADSLFELVKIAFEKGQLPEDDMAIKTIAIAQFEWNGQTATIRKSLIDPEEILDISYKVFLLSKEGDKVERRFVVEKTLQIDEDGAKHVLCEEDKKNGIHITYPYGWSADDIPIDDLEKAVKLVLDGKMGYSAKSNFGKN
jgi:tetratricopeptide (TPR) repeat protein